MKGNLLIFANDAASANMTIAYTFLYGKFYKKILAYPNGVAVQLYEQHIKSHICNSQITFHPTDTIVTGTSGLDSSYELNIINKAKISKVLKTIMIVDNTKNFNMRFSINNKIIPSDNLPNEIWVFDKYFSSNIDRLNSKLVYKENIYTMFIQKLLQHNKPNITHSFIKQNKNKYLVILTEYLFELYGLKLGFTEYEMLEHILKSIEESNIKIPIFLKLHPREHKNKFNILLRKYSSLNLIQDDCNIQELIYYSKGVFGINSSVFQECDLFQKPTFSIQIGSKIKTIPTYLKEKDVIYTTTQLSIILHKIIK